MKVMQNHAKNIRKRELSVSMAARVPVVRLTETMDHNAQLETTDINYNINGQLVQSQSIQRDVYGDVKSVINQGMIRARQSIKRDTENYNVKVKETDVPDSL